MANQETAYGMRPVGLVGAGANSTGVTEYEIASNNTNVIYQYEIVVPLAAGVIDQAGDTAGGTTQALGVLMGVQYHDSVQKKPVWLNYWPGSGSVSVDTNYPVPSVWRSVTQSKLKEETIRDQAALDSAAVRVLAGFPPGAGSPAP